MKRTLIVREVKVQKARGGGGKKIKNKIGKFNCLNAKSATNLPCPDVH